MKKQRNTFTLSIFETLTKTFTSHNHLRDNMSLKCIVINKYYARMYMQNYV